MISSIPYKKAMICLNGQPPEKKTVQRAAADHTPIIATDGGCNWLMDYGIVPDLVIGDLDSVKPAHLKQVRTLKIEDQHSTDLEKVFSYVLEQKFTDVDILGIEAGRIDHVLSNFFLLWSYTQKINIRIIGDDWLGFFMGQKQNFMCKVGTTFSIVPFTDCSGITLEGFKYGLDNATWCFGQVGLSNVVCDTKTTVRIDQGKALALVFDVDAVCQRN